MREKNNGIIIRVDNLVPVLVFLVFSFFSWSGSIAIVAEGMRNYLRIGLEVSSILFILAVIGKRNVKFNISILLICISFVAYYLISALWRYEGGTPSLIGVIVCLFLIIIQDAERAIVFRYIKKLLIVMSIAGIFCYVLYTFSIEIFPYTIIRKGDGLFCNFHISYMITNGYSLVRLCGLFEEPGMFGTFLAFVLCAEDLDFKNIWNIVLAIAGILTFSLAFFLLLAIYYNIKNICEPKKWIFVLAFVLFYIYVLPNITTGNNAIDIVFKRLTITDSGLTGDNRTSATFDRLFEKTIHSSRVIFGYGKGYAEVFGTTETEGLASIKSYIVNFGIIGTIIMFVPMIIGCCKRCENVNMLLYLVINIISLYQRPYLLQVPYFVMLICGLSYISKSGRRMIKTKGVFANKYDSTNTYVY